jgi:hypothetical protein
VTELSPQLHSPVCLLMHLQVLPHPACSQCEYTQLSATAASQPEQKQQQQQQLLQLPRTPKCCSHQRMEPRNVSKQEQPFAQECDHVHQHISFCSSQLGTIVWLK